MLPCNAARNFEFSHEELSHIYSVFQLVFIVLCPADQYLNYSLLEVISVTSPDGQLELKRYNKIKVLIGRESARTMDKLRGFTAYRVTYVERSGAGSQLIVLID